MENIREQIQRTQAKIDAIQEEQGTNLESGAELRKLKQIIQQILKARKKNWPRLKAGKKQINRTTKSRQSQSKYRGKKSERNTLEERLNNKKIFGRPERAGKRASAPKRKDQAVI